MAWNVHCSSREKGKKWHGMKIFRTITHHSVTFSCEFRGEFNLSFRKLKGTAWRLRWKYLNNFLGFSFVYCSDYNTTVTFIPFKKYKDVILNGVLGTFCAEGDTLTHLRYNRYINVLNTCHTQILTLLCLCLLLLSPFFLHLSRICPLHCRAKPHPLLLRKLQGSRRPLTRGLSSENG